MALNLTQPDAIATAAALISTPPPLACGSDTWAAPQAWAVPDVDALPASGGAVPA